MNICMGFQVGLGFWIELIGRKLFGDPIEVTLYGIKWERPWDALEKLGI